MNTSQGHQGLSSRAKALLTASLVCFFIADDYYMWVEQDNFPFISHGLFNSLFTARTRLLRFVVYDNQGGRVTVDSGRVIPIEWYRAVGLAEKVLVQAGDERKKEQVAQLLLERLNSEPWHAFDEEYASVRPPPGGRFIGMDAVYLYYDLDQYHPGQPPDPLQVERVFSYRLPGTP